MNATNIVLADENAITYYQKLSQYLDGKSIQQEHLTWFTTGRRSLIRFNGVLRTALPAHEDLKTVVDPVLDFFIHQNLPFFWVDWPPVGTPGLGSYLAAKGIPFDVFTMPAMMRSLNDLPPFSIPGGAVVAPVRSLQDQADWLDVFMEGFAEPEPVRPDFEQFLARSLSDPQPVFYHLVARWQGEPCAISTVLRTPNSAGIYHVATRPQYRGRGLGRALTLAAMQAAQKMGYSTVILFATPDGYPLYQKLGFETISTADLYAWTGKEAT
jgi:GNAT superfamily N-acetyltransferase